MTALQRILSEFTLITQKVVLEIVAIYLNATKENNIIFFFLKITSNNSTS